MDEAPTVRREREREVPTEGSQGEKRGEGAAGEKEGEVREEGSEGERDFHTALQNH